MVLRIASTLLLFLSAIFSLVEFIRYPGILENYFLPLGTLTLFAVVALFFLAVVRKSPDASSPEWLSTLNRRVLLPSSVLLYLALVITEFFTTQNFIFSTFGLFPGALVSWFTVSLTFDLTTCYAKHRQKHWQLYLFFSLLSAAVALSTFQPELFKTLSLNASGADDDNFMEWLQVAVLASGVILSVRGFFQAHTKLLRLLTVGFLLVFCLLIGEEISWGERILQLGPRMGQGNYQNELNLHNAHGLNELTMLLYFIAFLYAAGSWAFSRWWSKNRGKELSFWWQLLTVRGATVLFFLPSALFNPYADRSIYEGGPTVLDLYYRLGVIPDVLSAVSLLSLWRETFEVFFYLGLVLHFVNFFLWVKSAKHTALTTENH
jgi:hypothetical protein